MKYPDSNALLRSEPEAKRYYDALPDYVREQINSLKDYAENLTRGDD